jgi:hypothetical protein
MPKCHIGRYRFCLLPHWPLVHIERYSWGIPFNKPFRLFQWRYTVGLQTYYRPFWRGLTFRWRYRRGGPMDLQRKAR